MSLETVFSNHIYQSSNNLYKQTTGGAIGARITGVVAHIVMDRWADGLMRKLKEAEISTYLFTKYVDDCNLATSIVPKGFAWKKQKEAWRLVWTEEQEKEDISKEISDQERTMELVREISNTIVKGIKLTYMKCYSTLLCL